MERKNRIRTRIDDEILSTLDPLFRTILMGLVSMPVDIAGEQPCAA